MRASFTYAPAKLFANVEFLAHDARVHGFLRFGNFQISGPNGKKPTNPGYPGFPCTFIMFGSTVVVAAFPDPGFLVEVSSGAVRTVHCMA